MQSTPVSLFTKLPTCMNIPRGLLTFERDKFIVVIIPLQKLKVHSAQIPPSIRPNALVDRISETVTALEVLQIISRSDVYMYMQVLIWDSSLNFKCKSKICMFCGSYVVLIDHRSGSQPINSYAFYQNYKKSSLSITIRERSLTNGQCTVHLSSTCDPLISFQEYRDHHAQDEKHPKHSPIKMKVTTGGSEIIR